MPNETDHGHEPITLSEILASITKQPIFIKTSRHRTSIQWDPGFEPREPLPPIRIDPDDWRGE